MSTLVEVARRRLRVEIGSQPSVRRSLNWSATSASDGSGRVQLRRFLEGHVVPCRLFAVARHTVAVEVAGDSGSVDTEFGSQLADGGAGLVGLNEVDDGGGGEASLGRV